MAIKSLAPSDTANRPKSVTPETTTDRRYSQKPEPNDGYLHVDKTFDPKVKAQGRVRAAQAAQQLQEQIQGSLPKDYKKEDIAKLARDQNAELTHSLGDKADKATALADNVRAMAGADGKIDDHERGLLDKLYTQADGAKAAAWAAAASTVGVANEGNRIETMKSEMKADSPDGTVQGAIDAASTGQERTLRASQAELIDLVGKSVSDGFRTPEEEKAIVAKEGEVSSLQKAAALPDRLL